MKYEKRSVEKEIKSDFISATMKMLWHYTPLEIYRILDLCINTIALKQEENTNNYKTFIKEQAENFKIKEARNNTHFVNKAKQHINSKIKITEIARKYGLEVHKNKSICPFHADSDPSLSYNDEKNVFYCFGCHAKGDIIEFVRRMESQYEKK